MFKVQFEQKTKEEKYSFLLLWIGDKGWDKSNTWAMLENQAKLLRTYKDGFTVYLTPKVNPTFTK